MAPIRTPLHALAVLATALLLAMAGPPPVSAQTDETSAIQEVISSQIAAFLADDGVEAYSYASPTIQRIFQDADRFMSMVRSGYQPVYRPSEVTFLDLEQTPRGPLQRVLLVGPDGGTTIAEYFMQRQPDGSWKINGVRLVEGQDTSV